MAVLILLVKYIHSKQTQETFSAIVFHLAGICQFLNEDTVGRHAGILQIREVTRLSLRLGAWCAESAAAGSHDQTIVTGFTYFLHYADLRSMANLIFRKYLSQKDKVLALANSILENYNGNTDEDRRNEAALEMKQRELGRLQKRIDNLIEMRADGDLSKDMFRMKSEEQASKRD